VIERPSSSENVAQWKNYFSNSSITTLASLSLHDAAPFDLIIDTGPESIAGERLADFARAFRVPTGALLPGGVYVQLSPDMNETIRLMDVQQRGSLLLHNKKGVKQTTDSRFGLNPYDNVFQGYENEVKSVQVAAAPAIVIVSRKGSIDDSEWMTNGDDGLQYGEARQGLFARTLHRQFRLGMEAKRVQYLTHALGLFEVPLTGVEAVFTLPRWRSLLSNYIVTMPRWRSLLSNYIVMVSPSGVSIK